MKTILIIAGVGVVLAAAVTLLFLRGALGGGVQTAAARSADSPSFYSLSTRTLEGEPAALAQYAGKVALVVNLASKCGLTPQYAGLEALWREQRDEGFVILGWPSNDFLGQEPGTPAEIRTFCSTQYDVSFPLFEKVVVKGDGKCDIYRHLTDNGLEEPTWNFTKYLIGRDGTVLARFGPKTPPDDPELRKAIEAALAAD